MCLIKYHVLILCLIILDCNALNCRSDGGPKEAELKNIYKRCLKMQEGKNSSTGKHSEQDRREARHNGKSDWESDHRTVGEDRNDRDQRNDGRSDRNDSRDDRNNGRDGIINNNRKSGTENSGRSGDRNNRNRNERNDMTDNRDERYGRGDSFNRRETFPRNDNFGDMSQYNNYYSSTQSSRRYKRDKKPENSGHRSQYNPNTKKVSGFEDKYRSEDKNSSENHSSKERETDNKACAMHCFLENLEMTDEDGVPDRYLVAHAITKDVTNEDLKDFLQESIEECFQILDNENTEDKCDFSKKLLICLSEKGRANCDDWKEDLQF